MKEAFARYSHLGFVLLLTWTPKIIIFHYNLRRIYRFYRKNNKTKNAVLNTLSKYTDG